MISRVSLRISRTLQQIDEKALSPQQ